MNKDTLYVVAVEPWRITLEEHHGPSFILDNRCLRTRRSLGAALAILDGLTGVYRFTVGCVFGFR
jgi:hypothetical protein